MIQTIAQAKKDREDLPAFRKLANEARLLKAGRFNVSDDLREKFVGMGNPNYQVRRIIFTLAAMAEEAPMSAALPDDGNAEQYECDKEEPKAEEEPWDA